MTSKYFFLCTSILALSNIARADDARTLKEYVPTNTSSEITVRVGTKTFGYTTKLELGYYYQIAGLEAVQFFNCETHQASWVATKEIKETEETECEVQEPRGIYAAAAALWEYDASKEGYFITGVTSARLPSTFLPCVDAPFSILLASEADQGDNTVVKIRGYAIEESTTLEETGEILKLNFAEESRKPSSTDCEKAARFVTAPTRKLTRGQETDFLRVISPLSDLGISARASKYEHD